MAVSWVEMMTDATAAPSAAMMDAALAALMVGMMVGLMVVMKVVATDEPMAVELVSKSASILVATMAESSAATRVVKMVGMKAWMLAEERADVWADV